MAHKVPSPSNAACARRKASVQPFLPLLNHDQLVTLVRDQHFEVDGSEPTQDLRDVVEMSIESGALELEAIKALLDPPAAADAPGAGLV